MANLLLIDDDEEVLELNKKYLLKEGFAVFATSDPLKGIAFAKKATPDCVLLDVMMPVMDGFEVCKRLREFTNAPIIFLTGKGSEEDRINGLLTGADDYIVKPYSIKELKVRIDVILRRTNATPVKADANKLTFGNLVIDKLEHKAYFKEEDLGLANREYEVLLFLASSPNKEITFEEIGTALFGSYIETDRRSVMVNVSRLRKKLEFSTELSNMIETVWSKGYKFIAK